MKKFLLFFFSRLIMNLSAAYSSCPQSCSHVICIGEKALTNFCKSGVVMDSCNCCHVCAKTEGDLCGGYMDIQGKCREEFHCQLDKENIGHCRAQVIEIPSKSLLQSFSKILGDKSTQEKNCKPKCSPEFCSKNPNSICSGSNLKPKKQKCQGYCRHTVCSACYVKSKTKPSCPKCKQHDYGCIQSFAICVRKSSEKIWDLSVAEKNGSHLFTCSIPGCS